MLVLKMGIDEVLDEWTFKMGQAKSLYAHPDHEISSTHSISLFLHRKVMAMLWRPVCVRCKARRYHHHELTFSSGVVLH